MVGQPFHGHRAKFPQGPVNGSLLLYQIISRGGILKKNLLGFLEVRAHSLSCYSDLIGYQVCVVPLRIESYTENIHFLQL